MRETAFQWFFRGNKTKHHDWFCGVAHLCKDKGYFWANLRQINWEISWFKPGSTVCPKNVIEVEASFFFSSLPVDSQYICKRLLRLIEQNLGLSMIAEVNTWNTSDAITNSCAKSALNLILSSDCKLEIALCQANQLVRTLLQNGLRCVLVGIAQHCLCRNGENGLLSGRVLCFVFENFATASLQHLMELFSQHIRQGKPVTIFLIVPLLASSTGCSLFGYIGSFVHSSLSGKIEYLDWMHNSQTISCFWTCVLLGSS